jgi:hypothetical protein
VTQFQRAIDLTGSSGTQGINALIVTVSALERVGYPETLLVHTIENLLSVQIRVHCILLVTNVDDFEEKRLYEDWLTAAKNNADFSSTTYFLFSLPFTLLMPRFYRF